MRTSPLLALVLTLTVAFGIIHLVFSRLYIYWTAWWSDNLMHFLGGIILASLAVWFLYHSKRAVPSSKIRSCLLAVGFALAIGASWEVFEHVIGMTQSIENYKLDTLHDLVADTSGGIIGWLVATSKRFQV
jgi:uncharacterized membrane protein